MKRTVKTLAVLILALVLVSCSAERRGISHMRSLTTTIERHGDSYSIEEWKDAYDEFKAIDSSIDKSKLTPKQRQEYVELQTRCVKSFATSSVKSVKDGIATYIKEGIDVVKSVIDAILE